MLVEKVSQRVIISINKDHKPETAKPKAQEKKEGKKTFIQIEENVSTLVSPKSTVK